ncbi:tRNA(Ile)(2)-agmatinylcytidine synthase [Candidatus Nitrosopelagicus sp.]|nr:tRNA(Ile)(2)-agmatinylcytidine synthase [Candidatus Nitrosopelagicus sp.]
MESQVMYIGFDDTDSPKGMCTTYLAYKMVNSLKKEKVIFLDFPNLIRFNPNIPWKTRGNGAVGLTISTDNPQKIKRMIKKLVKTYSDTKNGANPGLVFFEKKDIPNDFFQFSSKALWKLIHRADAKKFILKHNLDSFHLGNGQGLVGAIGVIGYKFFDQTYELLSYRNRSKFGTKRKIDHTKVKEMQEKTFPQTFNNYDKEKGRVLITPHGPDPVFYGIRGEDPSSLISASKLIKPEERLHGYLIFKSNQGTGDHLKNKITLENFEPYTSGTITGIVSSVPSVMKGGHVFFSIRSGNDIFRCAVYKPTKITNIARNLIIGDRIQIGGGVRKATKTFQRLVNIEFINVLELKKKFQSINPVCKRCQKRMKSKGKNQGYQCVKCGRKSKNKQVIKLPRLISKTLYIPTVSAHRHLTRPRQRLGNFNQKNQFSKKIQWISGF